MSAVGGTPAHPSHALAAWLRALVAGTGLYGIGFILTRPTRELVEATG